MRNRLLLDEVFSVRDESFRAKSDKAMSDLLERAGIIVVVGHNLNKLSESCERAIWLENGWLMSEGDAQDVFTSTATFQGDKEGAQQARSDEIVEHVEVARAKRQVSETNCRIPNTSSATFRHSSSLSTKVASTVSF